MRCLLCGNPLSVLQKLTDADFCSAEHRNSFLAEQQRLMLDRLQQSAARIQQHRAKRTPLKPAPPPEPEIQAPEGNFVWELPAIGDRPHTISGFSDPLESPPELEFDAALASAIEAPGAAAGSLIPDFPWPRYNPGLWQFDRAEVESAAEHLESWGDHFLSWTPRLPVGWQGDSLQALGRPAPIAPPAHCSRISLRPLRPGKPANTIPEPPHVPLSAGLPATGKLFIPRPRGLRSQQFAPRVTADPIAVPITPEIPGEATSAALGEPQPLDRFFRMRPRSAVTAQTGDQEISAAPLATSGEAALPLLPADGSAAGLSGLRALLPIGPPPSADSETASSTEVPPVPLTLKRAAAPASPLTADVPDRAPLPANRFFRPRPRGPVADPAMKPFRQVDVQPVVCSASASAAAYATETPDLTPAPAGPAGLTSEAARGVFGIAEGDPEPVALPAQPSTPSARVSDPQPAPVERFFRPRPRGPVDDAGISGSESLRTDPLLGDAHSHRGQRPAYPTESPDLAPELIRRFFRPRPRGPLDDPATLAPETLPASATALASSGKPAPAYPVESLDLAPELVRRFFRPRPRGPVSGSIAATHSIASQPVETGLRCALPVIVTQAAEVQPRDGGAIGLDAQAADGGSAPVNSGSTAVSLTSQPVSPHLAIAQLEPQALERFFRPRPRGPVACASLSQYGPIGTAELPPAPARPIVAPREASPESPAPRALDRLFRPRPRGPLQSTATGIEIIAATPVDPEVRYSEPSDGASPAALTPQESRRFARPRRSEPAQGGKTFQPIGTEGCNFPGACEMPHDRAAAAEAAPSPANQVWSWPDAAGQSSAAAMLDAAEVADQWRVSPCLPRTDAPELECEPRFAARLFRPRLRPAWVDTPVEAIPASEASLASRPCVETQGVPQAAPVPVSRLYRPRPGSGTTGAAPFNAIPSFAVAAPPQPAYATSPADAFGSLAPSFLNRFYRVRPRMPLQDPGTVLRQMRIRHLAYADPEPLLATMPAGILEAAPMFMDRLYRMRPRQGKDAGNFLRPISSDPCLTSRGPSSPSGAQQCGSEMLKPITRRLRILAADLTRQPS